MPLGEGEGGGACEPCGDKCAGHYLHPEEHHDFYQTHGEDVEMWLQHLSDVSTRRKERAMKATATRRHKNKGHTEGSTKEK